MRLLTAGRGNLDVDNIHILERLETAGWWAAASDRKACVARQLLKERRRIEGDDRRRSWIMESGSDFLENP